MPSSFTAAPVASPRNSPVPIVWRVWPLGDGGRQLWLLVAVLLIVAVVVGLATESPRWMAVSAALVAAAAWRVFVPVVFELNALGVSQHLLGRIRRIPWSAIEYARVGREGVFFTLDGAALADFRGLYVPWESRRNEVLALVEYYLPASRREGNCSPAIAAAGTAPLGSTVVPNPINSAPVSPAAEPPVPPTIEHSK
jgi:hypothetical protein